MSEFDPSYFFFKLPLYSPVTLTEENVNDFNHIMTIGRGGNNDTFDGYNPFKRQESTFTGWSPPDTHWLSYGGIAQMIIRCKRYEDELTYLLFFDTDKHTVMKVGQYPSVADFHIYELKKYDKVLSKDKLKEFSRAIGLAANGIGIGSFVYLRRIFENLIWTTFSEHKVAVNVSENDFLTMRMEDKIQTLKDFLPKFLVDNKTLYSILSLGIHELKEEECLAYFDTVRVGIEIILDEKLEEQKRQEKMKAAQKQISDLHSKLKK